MRKFVGNTLIYSGLYFIWKGTLGAEGGADGGTMVLGFVTGIPLLACGYLLAESGREDEQEGDDSEAKKLLQADATTWPMFFLYLRPFESTNEFKVPENPAHNLFSTEMWERDGYDDIERVLSKALKPTGLFVTFGKPGEHRGAGRILIPDENWMEQVQRLMERATLILAMPSSNAGTMAELRLIKELNLLNKTIFVMPSTTGAFQAGEGFWAQKWDHMRLACGRFDLKMPPFRNQGTLFMLDTQSRLNEKPLPDANPVNWASSIEALLRTDEATIAAANPANARTNPTTPPLAQQRQTPGSHSWFGDDWR